jgi:hypothetical protein
MPTLGAPLDFAKLEGRNFQAHQLGSAPASPVKGQLYYNTADNTLYWWDGTAWQSAKGGSGSPTGAAGGDLSGTYPNPQIAAGTIVDADVAAANKDGGAAVPSLRTLGTGPAQAAPGNDARFTDARAPTAHKTTHEPGGSDALTVDAVVATGSLRTLGAGAQQAMPGNRTLDAIAVPAADLNLNSKRIYNLATPANPTDAATKAYADSVAQGLDAKQSVRVATTANIANLSNGPSTIDGVALVDFDRVLVKDQTTPAQNGIYTVQLAPPWIFTRALDLDNWLEVPNAYVWVEEGTANADTGWVTTADRGGTLGTTPIPWTQFTSAGQILGGAGLTKTGQTIDVGAGPGITVNPDTIQVANNGITNAMLADGAVDLASADVMGVLTVGKGGTAATVPEGALGARANLVAAGYYTQTVTFPVTLVTITQSVHKLRAQRGLIVQVQDAVTGAVELPDVVVLASGNVQVTWAVATTSDKIVTILG